MPRFEPVMDVVESLCLRSGDTFMRNKGLFLDCANDVWNDMNESVLKITERVKMPVRHRFQVNKRINGIDLPCPALRVSSVNVEGPGGVLYPVYRNDSIHDDMVEIGQNTNCECEFKCSYELCNTIKGYEVIKHTEVDKNPDGSDVTFDCIDKKVLSGGFLYEQKQYPLRQYVSGVWVDTVLHTENIKLCELEVDKNGCACDTPHNIEKVCHACGIDKNDPDKCCIGGTASIPPHPTCDTWKYYCLSKMDWLHMQCGSFAFFRPGCNNIYNINELGTRLLFPPNFGWSTVVVRIYEDISLDNLMIPYLAKPAFMTGLQYYATKHNEKKIGLSQAFSQQYSKLKWALFLELNKYRLAEYRMMLTPPVFVPSFTLENPRGYRY